MSKDKYEEYLKENLDIPEDLKVSYTPSAISDEMKQILSTRKYIDTVTSLQPNDTYILNASDPEFIDLYVNVGNDIIGGTKRAIIEILMQKFPGMDVEREFGDLTVELTVDDEILLHDINPVFHENKPMKFSCDIIAMDSRKTYIKRAYVVCQKCGKGEDKNCEFDKTFDAGYCINPECKKKARVVEKRTMKTDYVQTLLVQEPLAEAKHNSPVIFTAKIFGKHIGNVFAGQKKKVTGIMRSIPNKENENDIIIEVSNIVDLEAKDNILPTDEEMKLYIRDIAEGGFCDKLIDSFAPDVYSNELYKDIKLSILLQLASGVGTSTKRGDINQLLVGDPSMAKSVMLKAAQRIVQKSIFTSGKGASSAGLTIGIVKLSDGRSVAQAGVMPLCSGGFAMIDEMDKMNPQDRSSMHEAMEQQQVSIAKAGISLTLPAKTSVLGAANPKFGMYDDELSLSQNIDLPPPLLSRMDMIWLILDKVDEKLDKAKATHILENFIDEQSQREQYMDEEQLMAYLNQARLMQPKMPEKIKSKVVELYRTMRITAKEGMTIGTRQLEALIRMSTAHAKLLLKEEVDEYDVDVITRLLKSSYATLGVNLDTGDGKHQAQIFGGKSGDDKAQTFWKAVNTIADEGGLFSEEELINVLKEHPKFGDEIKARTYFGLQEQNNLLLRKGNKWKKA